MRRTILLAGVALLAMVAGAPAAGAAHSVNGKVCVVVDESGLSDVISASAAAGATQAARKLHVEVAIPDAASQADVLANIEGFVTAGDCDLIIGIGFRAAGLMEPFIAVDPDRRFAVIDYSFEGYYPNVAEVLFRADQPAFLAGYIAAGTSATGKVGTYGGEQIPPVTDFMNGYALGVDYYNARYGAAIEVLGWDVTTQSGLFAGSFDDPAAGRALTEDLFDLGVDTVFPVAGGTSFGSYEAAAVRKAAGERVRVIGVDYDWFLLEGDPASVLLTSAMKKFDVAVYHQIQALVDGTWQGGPVVEDLASQGVDIAPFHNLKNQVPGPLRNDLKAIRAGIIDGTIPTLP